MLTEIDIEKLSPQDYLKLLQDFFFFQTGIPIGGDRLDIDRSVEKWSKKVPDLRGSENACKRGFETLREHEGKTLFEQYVDITIPLLSLEDRNKLRNIPNGDLPILEPNAAAMKVPSGGLILIFNTSIKGLIHSFLEICFARLYGFLDDDHFFMNSILNGLWHASGGREGRFKNKLIPDASLEAWGHVEILTSIAEYFVASHEISHIILNHLDDSTVTSLPCSPTNHIHIPSFILRRHDQEYQADMNAVNIVLAALERSATFDFPDYKLGPAFSGVDIFFSILDFIELFWNERGHEITTHPPASKRRDRLREIYWDNFKDIDKKTCEMIQKLLDSVKRNIKHKELSFVNPDSRPCDSCSWPIVREDSLLCNNCKAYLCKSCVRPHVALSGHNYFVFWGLCRKCKQDSSAYYVNLTKFWTPLTFNESISYNVLNSCLCDDCTDES